MSAYSDAIVQMRHETLMLLLYPIGHEGEIGLEYCQTPTTANMKDLQASLGRLLIRTLNQIERAKKNG